MRTFNENLQMNVEDTLLMIYDKRSMQLTGLYHSKWMPVILSLPYGMIRPLDVYHVHFNFLVCWYTPWIRWSVLFGCWMGPFSYYAAFLVSNHNRWPWIARWNDILSLASPSSTSLIGRERIRSESLMTCVTNSRWRSCCYRGGTYGIHPSFIHSDDWYTYTYHSAEWRLGF